VANSECECLHHLEDFDGGLKLRNVTFPENRQFCPTFLYFW